MEISLTEFASRHFKKGAGTFVDMSPFLFLMKLKNLLKENDNPDLQDSFMDFCKYLIIPNEFGVRASSMPITLENYKFLRSGYSSRREGELPYLSRWFELPIKAPIAEYLVLILYSAEQIEKEGETIEGDWGIVGMQAVMTPVVEPMTPYTMIRNAMGIEEGGNGEKIDRDYLIKAAQYWEEHAIIN